MTGENAMMGSMAVICKIPEILLMNKHDMICPIRSYPVPIPFLVQFKPILLVAVA